MQSLIIQLNFEKFALMTGFVVQGHKWTIIQLLLLLNWTIENSS